MSARIELDALASDYDWNIVAGGDSSSYSRGGVEVWAEWSATGAVALARRYSGSACLNARPPRRDQVELWLRAEVA